MNERNMIAAILAAGLLQGSRLTGTMTNGRLAVTYYKDILEALAEAHLPPPTPPVR